MNKLKMYQTYTGSFWQKAFFSDRLHNSLLVPQSTLQERKILKILVFSGC